MGGLDDRVELIAGPTPLQPADRLAGAIQLPPGTVWVKRDDLTGLADGGNKVRKLEYLLAAARAAGATTLVTGGGPQSNHVRLSTAAAARFGLRCVAVMGGRRPAEPAGNVLLDFLLGTELVWAGDLGYLALEEAIQAEADRRRAAGEQVYVAPIGGASTTGTLGYVRAGLELQEQHDAVDTVVVADGSGGTHAGLVAAYGRHDRVLGVDVGTRPNLDDAVPERAAAVAEAAGVPPPAGTVEIDHSRIGAGYGAPTDACLEALRLAARTEGLVLDPVYSGKALAGLIGARREGRIEPGSQVVFVHTGGTPALFAGPYGRWIAGP